MLTSFLNFHLFFNFISNFFFFQLFLIANFFLNSRILFSLPVFLFASNFSFHFQLSLYKNINFILPTYVQSAPTSSHSQISFIKYAWKHHPELTEMGNLERKDPFNFPNHLGWPHFPSNKPPQRCLLMVLHTILYT